MIFNHMKTIKEQIFSRLVNSIVVENKIPCNIELSSEQMKALSEALSATKKFHKYINLDKCVLSESVVLLKQKRSAAAKFKSIFGFAWSL